MTMYREQEVTVKAGQKFSVFFNEAASAGYLWSVSENKDNIDVQGVTVLVPRSKLRRIGGESQIEFSGRVEKPGDYEIEFAHKRPWNNEVHETVRLKLTVQP
jgi:predicted secreted protein